MVKNYRIVSEKVVDTGGGCLVYEIEITTALGKTFFIGITENQLYKSDVPIDVFQDGDATWEVTNLAQLTQMNISNELLGLCVRKAYKFSTIHKYKGVFNCGPMFDD
jgi:hypothetical protein